MNLKGGDRPIKEKEARSEKAGTVDGGRGTAVGRKNVPVENRQHGVGRAGQSD